MRRVLTEGKRWLGEGIDFGRATLVRASGSAPFQVGSTLIASDDGRVAGGVSAGCIEGAVAAAVLAARKGGYREVIRYGISDERVADVELSCGGVFDVLVEPACPEELLAAAAERAATVVATPLPAGREAAVVSRVVLDSTGIRSGSLGDPVADRELVDLAMAALDTDASLTVRVGTNDVYLEVLAARQRLVVVGAAEIAVHLVRLAHAFGLETVVVDARTAFVTRERFPDADQLLVGWADELADAAGIDESAHVAALAHDPKFDDPALVTALRRRARYVGVLGSRRSHAERIERLRRAGIADADLARIHGPIGIDLGARTPAEIALGILAEIVAERRRTGQPAVTS